MRDNSEWISISDMMAGVMMIFMLIAVSYMYTIHLAKEEMERKNRELLELNQKMQSVAITYDFLQNELYRDLVEEFSQDLSRWNAIIDPEDNTIRFKEPDVFFGIGEFRVKKEFRDILDDFFPRYIEILYQDKYKESIEEVRIEGHTSKEWGDVNDLSIAYIENAALSQQRAFEVLKYSFLKDEIEDKKEWLIGVLRANGLSFARPLEDQNSSRRVEFRTITKANQKIMEILDISLEQNVTQDKER